MSRTIQIRDVPDALHRKLKTRAGAAGLSLSKYLLAEIKQIAEQPTLSELRKRLHQRERVIADIGTVPLLHEERSSR